MINKEIENVVFYNFFDNELKAYIFYKDGTIKNVDSSEGYKAVQQVIADEKLDITTKEDLTNKLINKDRVYVMSIKDLQTKFDTFLGKNHGNVRKAASIDEDEDVLHNEEEADEVAESKEEQDNSDSENQDGDYFEIINEEDIDPKKKGIFSRAWDKIRKSKLARRIAICAVALGIGAGGYALGANSNKSGQMVRSNIESETNTDNNDLNSSLKNLGVEIDNDKTNIKDANNINYNGFTFEGLQDVTTNNIQKSEMSKLRTFLHHFNGQFADKHVEVGKDIRAALSWEEANALNVAYNDLSKDEIKAIFNGAQNLKTKTFSDAYKTGTLQLMGAYIIETNDCKVGVDTLIADQEDLKVYNEYHDLFLKAKFSEGGERSNYLNQLYAKFNGQFPITTDVRTEGIAHADARINLNYEQLSAITPIVAAAEMMFQNEKVDTTLNKEAIDFLNDLGVCNYNDDKFESIVNIMNCVEMDKTNPTYDQYQTAIVKELKDSKHYVINDSHRDLSQLTEFQKYVNGHFQMQDGKFSGTVVYDTTSYTESFSWSESSTSTHTETTTEETSDRNRAVEFAGEEAVKAAENKVDDEIAKENEQAKAEAEKEAAKKQEEMQAEADKNKAEQEEEIKKDDQDLQDKIDNANDQIDNNNKDNDTSNDKPVNEDDFGDHNVDFDQNGDKDQDGNLDDDIKDVTTDGSGDQTNEPLPDPNANEQYDNNTSSVVENETDQSIYEYEEPVAQSYSNEEIANKIVEDMANQSNYEETETTQITK